ncbi:MAG TPA: adenosylcobinamide-GDP ribazoletransferase [Anaerolineales bacterium]|jgi:adenosylcobinamide-GDP ribazoletransferase
MVSLLAAFQFLTIFPTVIRRVFSADEMGRSVGFFPLVGLALGGILLGLDGGLRLFLPAHLAAVLVVAAWLLLTRALHFDGFLDIFDGLFGGFTPERRLEIMKDSRVGAFGVAAGSLLLFAKIFSIAELANRPAAFLLAPVLARWAMGVAIFTFPYAREKGLGRDMKDKVGWPQMILATLLVLAVAWFAAGWMGLLAFCLAGVLLFLSARYMLRLLPGLTGDSYGMLCELIELAVLVTFTVSW